MALQYISSFRYVRGMIVRTVVGEVVLEEGQDELHFTLPHFRHTV